DQLVDDVRGRVRDEIRVRYRVERADRRDGDTHADHAGRTREQGADGHHGRVPHVGRVLVELGRAQVGIVRRRRDHLLAYSATRTSAAKTVTSSAMLFTAVIRTGMVIGSVEPSLMGT